MKYISLIFLFTIVTNITAQKAFESSPEFQPEINGAGVLIHQWEAPEKNMQFFPDANLPGLAGRVIIYSDTIAVSQHATQLARLMIGNHFGEEEGIAPKAKIHAHYLIAYRDSLLKAAKNGMGIALHAFDQNYGWNREGSPFWGGLEEVDSTEDFHWGYYNDDSRFLDSVCWTHPYVLPVKSAGNSRGEYYSGEHYIFDAVLDSVTTKSNYRYRLSTTPRNVDGGVNAYDCLSPVAVSKNALTVGAYSTEYYRPVVNSAAGPTDDGRVKPDVMAPGEQTSQAAAYAAAGAALLEQKFRQTIGSRPYGFTLKNLLVSGARDLDSIAGPSYETGFGLMNLEVSLDAVQKHSVKQTAISGGATHLLEFMANDSLIKITLVYHDAPGDVIPLKNNAQILNNRQPRLVHNVNLSVLNQQGEVLARPFQLNPDKPGLPAQIKENEIDNVKQIVIAVEKGKRYQVVVAFPSAEAKVKVPYSLVLIGGRFNSSQ